MLCPAGSALLTARRTGPADFPASGLLPAGCSASAGLWPPQPGPLSTCASPAGLFPIPGTPFSGGSRPGQAIRPFRVSGTPAMVSLPTARPHIPTPTRSASAARSLEEERPRGTWFPGGGRHTRPFPAAGRAAEGGTGGGARARDAHGHFHLMFKTRPPAAPQPGCLGKAELISSQRGTGRAVPSASCGAVTAGCHRDRLDTQRCPEGGRLGARGSAGAGGGAGGCRAAGRAPVTGEPSGRTLGSSSAPVSGISILSPRHAASRLHRHD